MKHSITLICGIFLLLQAINAQVFNDSPLLKQYDKESIFLQSNRIYVKNGEKQRVGFLYKSLEQEMEISPIGKIEYLKAKNTRNAARIAGFTIPIIYFAPFIADPDFFDNTTSVVVWISALTAVTTLNVSLNQKSYNQMQRALWYRNRDVLLLVD